MFQIGAFSRIAQVSASQLRNYDQLGLFSPEKVDPQTGYRYYSARQLPQLNRIIALKELGLTLAQIQRLLADDISPDDLRAMLLMKKAQVEQNLQTEIMRLRYIESRIEQIDSDGALTDYDILLKSLPASPFLGMRAVFPTPQDARSQMLQLQRALPAALGSRALGPLTVLMHSPMLDSENLDIELGFPLTSPAAALPTPRLPQGLHLDTSELPAVKDMLTVTRVGHPRLAHGAYRALGTWAEVNGYSPAGPVREVFINFALMDKPQETVVELQIPVSAK